MEPNEKIEIAENEPLLAKSTSVRPKTPTKSFLLPLGMFMYACGLQLGSTTTKQFVYNYTSIEEGHKNSSLSLQAANDSQKSCDRNLSTSQHTDDKVAADWLLYFELIEYTIGIPVIVLAGIYSDFYGRRIFLLLPTFGGCLQYLILFGIIYYGLTIEYVCVIYGVSGIVGTHYTFYLIATSSVADTTGTGKSRSFHIMLIYLYMGIGLTSASLGTGFLIQNTGFAIPCAISSGLCFIGFLVMCNTHETLTSKLRSEKPPFCKTFLRFFGLFFGKGLRKKSDAWKFNLTLAAFFIMLSPLTATSSTTTLYLLGEPFCFSSEILGYFNGSTDFLHLVIATPILKLFHCCLHDETIISIGLIASGVPYMVMLAFATTTWMVFLGKTSFLKKKKKTTKKKKQNKTNHPPPKNTVCVH